MLALPFTTFGQAADFGLEVRIACRCGRRLTVDGTAPEFRDRSIMGTAFTCSTILPHGQRCIAQSSKTIDKIGRERWTVDDTSRAMAERHPRAHVDGPPRTFRDLVRRGEVAFLYDHGCLWRAYTVAMVAFDEPPWDRWLDHRLDRFRCPRCDKPLVMHTSHGPGTPCSPRFQEAV